MRHKASNGVALEPSVPLYIDINMSDLTKILLDESELPTAWCNIVPDLPTPPPPR